VIHQLLASPIIPVLLGAYSVIGAGTITTLVHPRLRQPSSAKVRQAVNSWWPPALIGSVAVLLGFWGALMVFAILSAWALREYLEMLPATERSRLTDGLAYAAVPVQYLALASGRPQLYELLLLGWVFGVLPLVRAFALGPQGTLGALPRLQLGLMLTVYALSHPVRIFLAPASIGPVGGAGLATLFLMCLMVNDAAQYAVGKLAGRHRLVPSLSPNKTWEGFLGGVAFTSAVAVAASPQLTSFTRVQALLLGVGISAFGLLGDLLISAVKRDAGVKDSGAVLPGQGGVLDRCDSMLIATPLFVHGVLPWLS
jgi:phosphatidate cytidylyltransferase